MRVLLVNIDSKLPNIALKKIEKYHEIRGDEVIWKGAFEPMDMVEVDKTYVSCIFTKNRELCKPYEAYAEIGGTGWDISKKLPTEIENMPLNINQGFTTRGCIRHCDFCFVPEKEGKLRIVGDLYSVWDGISKEVLLFDNNILGVPDHFIKICKQAQKENIYIDFNQGLDIRLLTESLLKVIKDTKIHVCRFAFDHSSMKNLILDKSKLLKIYRITGLWYVLAGFKSDFADALFRIRFLITQGQRAYCMRHESIKDDKRYTALARWCNSPFFGKGSIPFKTYLTATKDGGYYLKYFTIEEMKLWGEDAK